MRIALALKSIEYEPVWIDLGRGEHLSDEYAAVTATRQVPCLEIDDQRLFQRVAIVEYLDETRPEPPLLPLDPTDRATVRGLTEVVNSLIQPLHNKAVRDQLRNQFNTRESSAKSWSRYWIERRLGDLESALIKTSGRYCSGDQVTIADVFLFPQIEAADRFDVEVTTWPVISSVSQNLKVLPAFADSYAA